MPTATIAVDHLPNLSRLVEAIRASTPPANTPIHIQRAALENAMRGLAMPDATRVPVDANGTGAEWLRVAEAGDRTIVYLHGGAFGMGSLATGRSLAIRLGRAARANVLSVDYGIAPERPFPAGIDDVVRAYSWLLTSIEPESIALAGDSAGGGLAVSALLVARGQGLPMPAATVCLSPWVDLTLTSASVRTASGGEPVLSLERLRPFADAYLAGEPATNPLASPIFADLHSLPPMLVQVGAEECLLDDAIGLARGAEQAGVHVELEIWEHMFHMWHFYAPRLVPATQALERVGSWLTNRFTSAV